MATVVHRRLWEQEQAQETAPGESRPPGGVVKGGGDGRWE